MRPFPLKLHPDADLLESLKTISQRENAYGYILSVVGNLSRVVFQCPDQSKKNILKGNLEIITLNGFISPDKLHLHLSVSDDLCNVWGGHLEYGSIVLKGADILIGFLDDNIYNISNELEENNKLSGIEIYILKQCPWSKRALRLLNDRDIPHLVHLISNDKEFNELNKITNDKNFPQFFVDGKYIGGYDQFVRLIDNKK